ncbi:Sensitivity To Red Light Reduced-like SRR1 [Penicillium expansum]|nr:Sensitivity To Red Light Reduced-like SRR1 [Penicillium expansum]
MPHTSHPSHRKRPTPKRTQVTDDDGWTHVASGGNVRRVMRTRPRGTTEIKESESGISSNHPEEPTLTPAEAPGRLTLSELQAQFQTHRERWESSESWTKLTSVLDERLKRAQEQASTSDATSSARPAVPSTPLSVLGSEARLAALASIKDQVACTTSSNLKVYAQDPVFNTLDESLLAALNITVIKHPEAFSHITANTMLFCPGAERKHLELLLPSKPWLLFGGPLEHADSDGVLQGYVDGAGSYCLPVFEALEHAFWNMRLYWVEDVVGEE